jgi:hypothetical protein
LSCWWFCLCCSWFNELQMISWVADDFIWATGYFVCADGDLL